MGAAVYHYRGVDEFVYAANGGTKLGRTHLEIEDLHVSVEGKAILKGLTLTLGAGEIHAVMGPNGSGKSTLAFTLLGHPRYNVTHGDIRLDGHSVLEMDTD